MKIIVIWEFFLLFPQNLEWKISLRPIHSLLLLEGHFLISINTYFKITDLHRINSPWNFLFKVYQTELEKVEKFDGFQDFISSFPFYRGKAKSREEEEDTVVGEFKVEDYFLVCQFKVEDYFLVCQHFLEKLCLLY